MEKVKVDTEIRKLDTLRSAHRNQQYKIRGQLSSLPDQIQRAKNDVAKVTADIETREANASDDFTMAVGNKTFSGDGARKEAATALTNVILSWRDDPNIRNVENGGHWKSCRRSGRGRPSA